MITVEMMKAAAESGLSVVCATCERYWEARSKGIVGDRCLSLSNCGSPLAKDDFHEYRGALTDRQFARCCFVCGEPAVKGLRKAGGLRIVGVCAKHAPWMNDPSMHDPVPAKITDKSERNYLGLDPTLLKGKNLPRESSLAGVILKTEKEWADKSGYEFDLGLLGLKKDAK